MVSLAGRSPGRRQHPVLAERQRRLVDAAPLEDDSRVWRATSTLDNGATYSELRVLARGLDRILACQVRVDGYRWYGFWVSDVAAEYARWKEPRAGRRPSAPAGTDAQ
jgi:hypothetical protein